MIRQRLPESAFSRLFSSARLRCCSPFFTTTVTFCSESGFSRKSNAPSLVAFTAASMEPWPEIITTTGRSANGTSWMRGGETFEDIGGVENVKSFLRAVLAGIDPPRVIVFIDEFEKAFAGTGTDLSGVKTEMTGTILTYMQDREADGIVFVGTAGAAKSAAAKATGGTAGIPTIAFDLPAMESSLVDR